MSNPEGTTLAQRDQSPQDSERLAELAREVTMALAAPGEIESRERLRSAFDLVRDALMDQAARTAEAAGEGSFEARIGAIDEMGARIDAAREEVVTSYTVTEGPDMEPPYA